MKKNMKRVLAFLLAVCTVCSLLPTMVIAVGGGTEDPAVTSAVYNFVVQNTDLVDTNGKSLGNGTLTHPSVKNAIDGYYATEALNWKFAANNFAQLAGEGGTANDASYFGGSSYTWKGLRTGVNVNGAYTEGYWVAFTIRIPVSGTYDVTLNYQTRADGAKVGEIYLLPGAQTNPETIDDALTVDNLEETVDFTSNSWTPADASAPIGKLLLEQGEYTLVFKAKEKKTGAAAAYMFLNNLTINLQEQLEALEEADYDFSQATLVNAIGGNYANKYFYNLPDATLAEKYADGVINWMPAASNKNSFIGETYSATTSYLGYGNGTTWSGLRLALDATKADGSGHAYLTNYWFAFNIKSPGEGKYDVSLKYQTRADANQDVKVYLLPGGMTDPAQIQTALDSTASLTAGFDGRANSDGSLNKTWTFTDATRSLGTLDMVEGEYTLVVQCASASGNYFFLNGLHTVAHRELPPEETTTAPQEPTTAPEESTTAPEEPTTPDEDVPYDPADPEGGLRYNFALAETNLVNQNNKPFDGACLTNPSEKTAVANYYANGLLHWNYALDNKDLMTTDTKTFADVHYFGYGAYKWTGLRLGVCMSENSVNTYPAGYWVAFTIQSPGKGDFDWKLSYQDRADGTEAGEIYLLKGTFTDAAAVEAAMNEDTLLKTVNFKSKSWDLTDLTADLGTASMEQGEYTLVFKATKGVQAGAYIFINEMTAVPHTEKPTIQVDKLEYNFGLQNTQLTFADDKKFGSANMDAANVSQAIADYYDTDTLRWKYTANNASLLKTETNISGPTNYFGGGENNYKWTGLRLGVNIKEGDSNTYPAGHWTAFTLMSPGKGKYQLTLDYQTRADGTAAGEMYLLKGTFKNAKAIDAALAANQPLQTINFKSTSWDMEDNQTDPIMVNLEKGEYTLVFKATQGTDAGAYVYINKLTAIHESKVPAPPAPPQLDTGIYDFVLEDTDLVYSGKNSFDAAVFTNPAVQSAIDAYYKNGKLNWKYHSSYIPEGSTSNGSMFGGTAGGKTYSWNGLRFYSMTVPTPMWHAFTIKSPGTGTYYPAMNYMKNVLGAAKGKIYLLPGNTEDVQKAIASGTAIAEISYDNRTGGDCEAASEIFRKQPLELKGGEEYILVFTAEEPGAKTKGAFAYLYLNQFILYSEKTLPDPGPNIVTYDFDVTDRANGIYTEGKVELENIKADIANRYAKGEIAWKYEAKAATMIYDVSFPNYIGMTAYSYEDDWMAFRCKAPGDGVYTLTMNYGVSSNGALGAIYILPGDTKDVAYAMDHDNRIKKVPFYNETGESGTTDGLTVTLGALDFTGEDEFILVFEAYDNSPYSNFAYMYVSQVIATEGNYVKEESAKRKINSVVVINEPVKTYETTQYSTTAVVNGVNYFFVPVEGKRMVIYNLDDMTRVRSVNTPFGVCRGITTDKDGNIWMVGDKGVIFRYDPVTEVSFTSRNIGVEIPGCYGGFSIAASDEGMLYFGSYSVGSVVKYNPATDEFTNLGEFNEDCGYSCGAIIRDNYLYIGLTGDRNGDGVRTSEMVKIDLATEKVVGRTEITKQVGQDEVCVRGTGIAGNTMFVGGSAMEEFIAIDINTMELKPQYEGFWKPIYYCGTPERDGKTYFVVSGGVGLCEYDSATDTVTNMKMETSNYPLRAGDHCYVTLDDPLYPGETIVTHTGGAIVLYNMETKRVGYFTDMIDEDLDGSGMVVTNLANGPEDAKEVYLGAFNTNNCTAFNIETGEISRVFEATGSQTDVMLWHEGVLYTGNYNNGAICRINPNDEHRNVILLSLNNDIHEQNRIHALAIGDGKLFAGTMPRTDTYDGCLVMIDLETLENTVVRNIVDGCSVSGLSYAGGLVFGATSYSGGTGTVGPKNSTTSAKIFVYDPVKKEKVGELDPRDFFPGLPKQVPYIDALAADPDYDTNGRVWAMVSETLFCFTFDKDTGKFKVQEVLSYTLTDFPNSNGRYASTDEIQFKDEYLYVAMGNYGGFHKVNLSNFADHSRVPCETPSSFVIAEDGNVYYSIKAADVRMYPLDVTEEDWKAAEAVDAMIKAIGKVTMENADAVLAARAAYDAMPMKLRALIQNYDLLQIAETDLLEAKIDSIGEVTLDSQTLIEELSAQYEGMPMKEQKYVKNYSVLVAARKVLQKLIDEKMAAEVQMLIDTIKDMGEITLEKEAAIIKIREAFDNLTFVQKQLVDTTLLLDAEAKIKALRQVRIDRLKELIASIGDVTLEDEPIVDEAMEIYDWLYMDEREQVDYIALVAAEKALIKLQKAAAAEVDVLIEAIGDSVGYGSGKAIKAARKAFESLTPGSQKYVKLLDILEEAEAIYNAMLPLWAVIVIAVVVIAAAATAVVVVLRKRKKSVIPAE